ncbi:MAG: hypothetical protein J5621_08350 [Paludibacteraceae bacterium]|nr:hypothetical protein [Paludibacteraceae bacterium]
MKNAINRTLAAEKKLILLFAACLIAVSMAAQEVSDSLIVQDSVKVQVMPTMSTMTKSDSLLTDNNELLELIERDISLKERYKLYPTENIYNFLLLDTKTGQIDKVQWNLEDNKEFISSVNRVDLSYSNSHFELYPTQNMYQFILLDKATGRVWHVQWGLEKSKRWIQRIY